MNNSGLTEVELIDGPFYEVNVIVKLHRVWLNIIQKLLCMSLDKYWLIGPQLRLSQGWGLCRPNIHCYCGAYYFNFFG